MQEEYRGYTIKYNTSWSYFEIKIGENDIEAKTLQEAHDKVDSYIKKEASFDKIDVLCSENRYGNTSVLSKGQITSIAEITGVTIVVWITVNGLRTKRALGENIFLDTPENAITYSQIQGKKALINSLEKEIKDLYLTMTKPDLKDKAAILQR